MGTLRFSGAIVIVDLLALVACGTEPDAVESMQPGSVKAERDAVSAIDTIKRLDQDLSRGSRGMSVQALHQWLTQFGYFPNKRLEKDYPSWQPIVAISPEDPNVYDEYTTEAVRAFQANFGLPQSGNVDAATRALLAKPRCQMPDGLVRFDPSDKYDLWVNPDYQANYSWMDYHAYIPLAHPFTWTDDLPGNHNLAMAAVNTWMEEMPDNEVTYTMNSTANLHIRMGSTGGLLGVCNYDDFTITLSDTANWGAQYDMQAVILHEFGHALGLGHSGFPDAVMYPIYHAGDYGQLGMRTLTVDEKVAVSLARDNWDPNIPGAALDIGVGLDGCAWVVGSDMNVWKSCRDPSNGTYQWVRDAFAPNARRISVGGPGSTPWVVDINNNVAYRTTSDPNTGTWIWTTGYVCAQDIGAGADGTVWITHCNTPGTSDGAISRYSGRYGWSTFPGAAVKVAVNPLGVPWVVNSNGSIYRMVSGNGWQNVQQPREYGLDPTDPLDIYGKFKWAFDIGISPSGMSVDYNTKYSPENAYAWVIAGDSWQYDKHIFAWNEQPGVSGGASSSAFATGDWLRFPGEARHIAVGPKGEPWVVQMGGRIFTTTR